MKYLTGHSQEIRGLLDALGIPCDGVMGIRLIVEPDHPTAINWPALLGRYLVCDYHREHCHRFAPRPTIPALQ
jgi:hypothetical protein